MRTFIFWFCSWPRPRCQGSGKLRWTSRDTRYRKACEILHHQVFPSIFWRQDVGLQNYTLTQMEALFILNIRWLVMGERTVSHLALHHLAAD